MQRDLTCDLDDVMALRTAGEVILAPAVRTVVLRGSAPRHLASAPPQRLPRVKVHAAAGLAGVPSGAKSAKLAAQVERERLKAESRKAVANAPTNARAAEAASQASIATAKAEASTKIARTIGFTAAGVAAIAAVGIVAYLYLRKKKA